MWMIGRRTNKPLRLQSDGQERLGYVQRYERSQRLADRTMRRVVGGLVQITVSFEAGDADTCRADVTVGVPVACAVLHRQVKCTRQASGLSGENRSEQNCEQASFHGIFNGCPRSQTVRPLTRARLFMIIRTHSQ